MIAPPDNMCFTPLRTGRESRNASDETIVTTFEHIEYMEGVTGERG